MQQSISRIELGEANVVVRPSLPDVKRTDFQDRNIAIPLLVISTCLLCSRPPENQPDDTIPPENVPKNF